MKRFDERDTIFSRLLELKPGSPEYLEYYEKHPCLKESDDILRDNAGGEFDYDVLSQKLTGSTFRLLKNIRPQAHGNHKSTEQTAVDPAEITSVLKNLAAEYGAVLSGVAPMQPDMYYSYRGRGDKYGEKVTEESPYCLVFAVEMNKENLLTAPGTGAMKEVVKGYSRVALIGMVISYFIQNLGYDAFCHMDGQTTIPMVPVAQEAGLGEIGRIGLLITKEYGARIRLGAVTTTLPLVPDDKRSFGLRKVCRTCKKCAKNCPAGAIDNTTDEPWQITNDSLCYRAWKKFGTDCGVCLMSCPFSQ